MHLLGDAVFLHERLLCMVEHERVVGRERDIEPDREELVERVLRQTEEERVIRQWRERQPDLRLPPPLVERRQQHTRDAARPQETQQPHGVEGRVREGDKQ